MKNKKLIIGITGLIVCIVLIIIVSFLHIKRTDNKEMSKTMKSYTVDELKGLNNGKEPQIYYDDKNRVKAINGNYTDITINNESDAIKSLNSVKDILAVKNPDEEFISGKVLKNEDNSIYRLQQVYNGDIVYSNELVILVNKDGKAQSITGKYIDVSSINLDVKVTKEEAISKAEEYSEKVYGVKYEIDKVIYIKNDNPMVAWKVKYVNSNNITKNKLMFISAEDGSLIDELPLVIN